MRGKKPEEEEEEEEEEEIQALAVWWKKWKLICLPFEISSSRLV